MILGEGFAQYGERLGRFPAIDAFGKHPRVRGYAAVVHPIQQDVQFYRPIDHVIASPYLVLNFLSVVRHAQNVPLAKRVGEENRSMAGPGLAEVVVEDHHRRPALLPGLDEKLRHVDGIVRVVGVVAKREVAVAVLG